jgi:hypothetical protein
MLVMVDAPNEWFGRYLGMVASSGQRVAVSGDLTAAVVLRSAIAYQDRVEPELLFLAAGDAAARASESRDSLFRVGFSVDSPAEPAVVHGRHERGGVEWMVDALSSSSSGRREDLRWQAVVRFKVEPLPTSGRLFVAVDWDDAGIGLSGATIAVPLADEIAQHVARLTVAS